MLNFYRSILQLKYIEVESKEDTQFSLLISKESSIIKLFNDEPITKTITNQFDFFTFLLTEETEIAVYSLTANIRIFVNIIQINPPTREEFPTNDENSQFQSLNDNIKIESSVFLSLDDIERSNCYNNLCYAAITCTHVDPSNQDIQEYTIIRSSGAVKLIEAFIYSGMINQNKIKYFKVVDVKEAIGVQIFVTASKFNQITIIASVNSMPTQQSHNFNSSFNYGDFLLIPPKIDSEQIVTYQYLIQSFIGQKYQVFEQYLKLLPLKYLKQQYYINQQNKINSLDFNLLLIFTNLILSTNTQVCRITFLFLVQHDLAIMVILNNRQIKYYVKTQIYDSIYKFRFKQFKSYFNNQITFLLYLNYYSIGVFALEELTMSIQIKMGLARFYRILMQQPFSINLPSNSTTYLQFKNSFYDTIRILISSNSINDYIKPKIHIISFQKDELSSVMNNIQFEYYWKMEDYYLEISNSSKNFCQQCLYLIYLENNYFDIQLTITVARKNHLIQLQDNLEVKNQLQINESDIYLYTPRINSNFYLNVTVFKGKIYIFDKKNGLDDGYSNLRLILEEQDGTRDYMNKNVASREGIYANRSLFISSVNQKNNLSIYEFQVFSNFTTESIYQIEIIDQNQAIELKIGQPQSFKISSLQQSQLYFVIPNRINNYSDDYYSITIEITTNLQDRIIRAPGFTLKQDKYNNPDIQSDYHDFVNVQISVIQELDTITYIQIPSIEGLYFLTINPQEIAKIPYSITLGNKDFNILTPKSYRLVRTKVGEQQIWEIHLQEASNLFVQAQLCGGIVNVFGSSSRDDLIMGLYKDKIDSIHNKQLIGIIPSVSSKIYYLNTKTIKSTTQKDIVSYILRFDTLKDDTIVPVDHFYSGNDGEFQISLSQNYLDFQFSPIQSTEKSSQNYVLESITYTFIYQKQSLNDNSPLDKCNQNAEYQSFTIKRSKHDPQKTLNQRIQLEKDDNEKILATIQATVNIKTQNFERLKLSYQYKTKILELNTITNNGFDETTKGIFIIFMTMLILALFLLIIKYRNLRQIAKFEAQAQQSSRQYQEQQIEMNYTNLGGGQTL